MGIENDALGSSAVNAGWIHTFSLQSPCVSHHLLTVTVAVTIRVQWECSSTPFLPSHTSASLSIASKNDPAMFTALRPSVCASQSLLRYTLRWFGVSAAAAAKQMPPRPTVNEEDIEEAFLKGSGPGGQKIVIPPLPRPPHIQY